MATDKKKSEEENVPKTFKGWIVIIIPCVISALGLICVEMMKESHEKKMNEAGNTYMQHFYNKADIVMISGMEFLQYKITSEPIVKGFHVIAYPYVVCETEEKNYIPVKGQFTQNEYVTDAEGCCTLFRENTSEDFIKMINNMVDFPVEMKCLVAIQYVVEDEVRKEIYDIKDGQLTKSDQEIATKVLEAWESGSSVKIDMMGWPDYDQKKLEEIFS